MKYTNCFVAVIGLLCWVMPVGANEPARGMLLTIAEENLTQFKVTANLDALVAKVSANLNEWHYEVSSKPNEHTVYSLSVDIGHVKNDSTPVGFSFSSGNSDPRALGFQKSNIVPITCRLQTRNTPQQSHELAMNFSAHTLNNATSQESLLGHLADDISSVCFDLLESLHLPKPKMATEKTITRPAWMPNIQVETINPEPASVSSPEPSSTQPANTAKPSVETESVPESNTQRKQIIIHNQGTPLIIEFGHQRR